MREEAHRFGLKLYGKLLWKIFVQFLNLKNMSETPQFPIPIFRFEQQKKSFSIFKFNGNLNVDLLNWPKQCV